MMSEYTIPEPRKVRALRIPADDSDPHLITLETLMVEPDPPRQPGTYHALLSQLQEEEIRHLPNLLVFWGSKGWKSRTHFTIDFTAKNCQKLEGQYYVFMTLESNGLQLNKHLSSHLGEYRGDAFVLKALDYSWGDDVLLDDIMFYLEVLRKMSLYPEYVDVDDEILDCNAVQAVARVLLREADGFTEPDEQMDSDDEETRSDAPSVSDGEARTFAETGDEPEHDSTASPSPRGAGEIQEEEGEPTDDELPEYSRHACPISECSFGDGRL